MSQDELCQQASAVQISQGQMLNITLLASEWKSTAGGLSTLNRELAINLSQIQNVRVSLFVPEGACNDKDKMEAKSFGISILDAKKYVDFHPISWLSNPPQDHKIDVIVGHGLKLGRQVQLIKKRAQFQNCKWVHVVHTASEDLGKYKVYRGPISKVEIELWEEVDLCKNADLVVPVGPKLRKAYHGYLQGSKKKEDFFELIPGLFEREFADLCAKQNPKDERDDFIVLLCGHGDMEDFEVKGYNIAVKAFTDQRLKGKRCYLLFVGSPEGKQDEVREKLLKYGITDEQLTVREFVKSREGMKQLFCEVDMVINPSKSEGFGLVALEALSAGLPILVGSNSGFARAIENIPLGSFSVVDSEDPSKWAEGIEDVRDRHRVVLLETKMLRENYSKKYCWKTQCEELVDRLWNMVYGEERQPFPRLGEMRPALPIIPPLPTIRSGQDGAQGESELITTPDLASSFTRVARFEGFTFASAQREPLSPGEPGEIDPLQTSTRLTSLRSRLGLDRDGAFLDPEKYDPIKRLGSGGFAKVYMVRDKRTGKITACKMFDLGENDKHIQEKTKKVEQEVRILSALKHRFIVEFDHTDQRRSTFLIFMECMEGGSVAKLLNEKGPLEEPMVQIFTRQLLDAVDFLHNNPTKPVIHKDIKGANVLLDKLQKNIKLTDFGLCTEMNTLKTATGGFVTKNNIASFLWTSPEMLANKPFGRNTDIWSVGCTVIEMLTSCPPLMDPGNEHLTNSQRMYIIEHRELKPPGSCSSLVCRFLKRCLSDRKERPSASELLKTDDFVKFLSD